MKTNVAVYFRCSTDKQDKSISDQRNSLVDYANEHDMEIISWFDKDHGKSGTSFEKRPDFMRMVRLVESGQHGFKTILVYDIDRWGRPTDADESIYWEVFFRKRGVTIVYVTDESVNDNSFGGRLNKKLKQELATEESRKRSHLIRERSKLRAAEGFRVGGFAPYGYKRKLIDRSGATIRVLEHGERKYEKSQRVVLTPGDKREIRIVLQIFKSRKRGLGYRAIAEGLNRQGVPSPSARKIYGRTSLSKWSVGAVKHILQNPVYRGDWVYNRQARGSWVLHEDPHTHTRDENEYIVARNAHQAIVPKELFDRVNTKSTRKGKFRQSGMSYRSNYLLSGLITCVDCGYKFQGHTHASNGKKYRYYEDSSFKQRGESVCSQSMIPADQLERFALLELERRMEKVIDRNRLRVLIEQRLKYVFVGRDESHSKDSERLLDVERRIQNLKDSIEQGVDVKFVGERLNELDTERRSLMEEIKTKSNGRPGGISDVNVIANNLVKLSHNAFTKLQSKNPQKIKDALRVLIDRVEVDSKGRKASFFINKMPTTTTSYSDLLPPTVCRRSDSNRHDVAIGGF